MRKYIVIFLFLASVPFVYSKDSTSVKKSISFSQGINQLTNKDYYRSPYVYQGLNPYMSFTSERTSLKFIQRVNAGFSFGHIKTSFSPLASNNLLMLTYSYQRKVISNKRYSLYVGPQIDGISWRVNYFPEMQVPGYAKVNSYILGISLGAVAHFEYTISPRSKFTLSFSGPLCSYMQRPHFLDGSSSAGTFQFFNYWNPQARISYEYKASDKVSICVNYQYNYIQYSQPKPIRMLSNGISLGIKLKF